MSGNDVLEAWNDIVLRMDKALENTPGLGIMTVTMVVKNRRPIVWVRPKIIHLEPGYKSEELIGYLTKQ